MIWRAPVVTGSFASHWRFAWILMVFSFGSRSRSTLKQTGLSGQSCVDGPWSQSGIVPVTGEQGASVVGLE